MRIRTVPLGYEIENGEIVINEQEANIVKGIFDEYCGGSSLKTLVNTLTAQNAVFKINDTQWNKGRVYHILTDRRYIGEKSYPQIIDTDLFEKANGVKDSKRVNKRPISAEVEFLKEKVFCGKCGGRYIRIIDSDKKERWVCSNGCKFGSRPTDEKLLSTMQAVVLKVHEAPELLIQPMLDAGYTRTLEIMRLTNEIARMNEQVAPSFNTGKTLLFRIAASKFSACKEDKGIYTEYVSKQIHDVVERGSVDVPFFRGAIHKVFITGNKEYEIVFVNGAKISNKEKVGSASKISNENRS